MAMGLILSYIFLFGLFGRVSIFLRGFLELNPSSILHDRREKGLRRQLPLAAGTLSQSVAELPRKTASG
jgi:hypothetical protein